MLKNPRDATTAQLESWLQSWYTVIDGLFSVPDYETRLYLFHLQIKGCKILSEDINHYERAKSRREPDGSLDYLVTSVERLLERTRQDANRQGLSHGLRNDGQNIIKAPALPGPRTPIPPGEKATMFFYLL